MSNLPDDFNAHAWSRYSGEAAPAVRPYPIGRRASDTDDALFDAEIVAQRLAHAADADARGDHALAAALRRDAEQAMPVRRVAA